jgi:hypothetical protein
MAWLSPTTARLVAVVALAILATCFSSFFARRSGLPAVARARRARAGTANSAWATLDNLAYIVGPAVAGILVATADLVPAFLLNAPRSRSSRSCCGAAAVRSAGDHAPPQRRPAEAERPKTGRGRRAGPGPPRPLSSAEPALPEHARSIVRPVAGLTVLDVVAAFVGGGWAC